MAADENALAHAIGTQIRSYRKGLAMTVVELAKASNLSAGMISKIERGVTPPSLATLSAVARALQVPVTALFRSYEEQRDAKSGGAERRPVEEHAGPRARVPQAPLFLL